MSQLLKIILAIFLPFIAVLIEKGLGKDFLINILLCVIGYIPGIIHALWIVSKK
ncbi:YqaE/Pmp3 family membrane protein [Alteromonas sp. ASW11-36]|uniref:YqaE/Pmp3 family membrane protein n=1 Tax=Alteromonas arenosi TaxID=3055817 RepID=A0ABT7SXN4_9ALTE|nr:YqaE/Pmp3 family membrane protein [Alteromonas sp. ASW11-36]MDM7860945.1 YqaE/Pmp3 family membrane protein [Alteromonas sp. ASW11-36]